MTKPTPYILALLLLCCLGCSTPLSVARVSYATARAVYDATEPAVEARYKAEQQACVEAPPPPEPCVAEVRKRWAPVRKASLALYAALTALGASLGVYDALSSGGRTPSPSAIQEAVGRALDAAAAFSAAITALEAP